jgi:DNA polymerase sigma
VSDDVELRKRRDLVVRLQNLVSHINRNARLELFGSAAIPGLALKESDIDLGIVGVPTVRCCSVANRRTAFAPLKPL